MKTVKNVAPYRVKYRIWDTNLDSIEFETEDFEELCAVYYSNYVVRGSYYDPHVIKDYLYAYGEMTPVYRFVIKTEFGDVIDNTELDYPFRKNRRREQDDIRKQDIRYKKGNPNKIKRGYYNYGWWWEHCDYYEVPYISRKSYRKVRTTNEKRQNANHVADYGSSVVRGSRSKHNLPDSWDDIYNGTWFTIKSWKHHSKRRHQWKPKD